MHYGETEKISIINIAKELNFSFEEIDSLASRFIDLHTLIRKSWILPIRNYTLKTVANWMGFKWKQKNVSGSKALYWWLQYKTTLNDIFLKNHIKNHASHLDLTQYQVYKIPNIFFLVACPFHVY